MVTKAMLSFGSETLFWAWFRGQDGSPVKADFLASNAFELAAMCKLLAGDETFLGITRADETVDAAGIVRKVQHG